MDSQKKRSEKRLSISALDVFIVMLVVLCIVGIVLRFAFGIGVVDDAGKQNMSEYLVSYSISSVRTTSSDYFKRGTEFFLNDDSGESFGIAEGNITITPAEYYIEDDNGNLVLTYYPENGDESLVDIKGTMKVSGINDSDTGVFMLNGDLAIAPNKQVEIRSTDLVVTIIITDITKSS